MDVNFCPIRTKVIIFRNHFSLGLSETFILIFVYNSKFYPKYLQYFVRISEMRNLLNFWTAIIPILIVLIKFWPFFCSVLVRVENLGIYITFNIQIV